MKLEPQPDNLWHATETVNGRLMLCEGRTQGEAYYGLIEMMSDRFNDQAEAMMQDLPALVRRQAV